MFLDLVTVVFADFACNSYQHNILEMFLYLAHLLFWCVSVCVGGWVDGWGGGVWVRVTLGPLAL